MNDTTFARNAPSWRKAGRKPLHDLPISILSGLNDSIEFRYVHTCADASDRIFDHCFSRSSEPTTPT